MSKYVNAEWLLGVAKLSNGIIDIDDIYNAPSIDIVTCYMCKHSHMTYDGQCKYCDNITDDDGNVIEVYFDADHFCSYGERNSSEKPNNSTTEPQKIGYCNECKWFRDKQVCRRCRSENMYAPKDEPNSSEKSNNSKGKE